MKSLIAFIKKEILEQVRSGKVVILGILFILFGIMNPAVAKLTPWLLEMMSESMAESGIIVTEVNVTAMDSWVQFFKNIPMALIVFVLVQGGIFIREYQTGTLVLSLTKGLERYKIVVTKTLLLMVLWTTLYWMCFGITYAYNAYFWDNSIAQNLMFSVVIWWLFGIWVISLLIFISTIANSSSTVLITTGGIVFLSYLIAMIPKVSKYMPTMLNDGNSLIYGTFEPQEYAYAIVITITMSIMFLAGSIPLFNKKMI